jgi:hypothetical protein
LTITGLPSTSITFTTAPTGAVYLAYYNGTAWATIAGPGTLSGTTVTFGNTTFANPLTIATGASLFLAVYTGGVLVPATPTPGPSASASSSASPGASSSPSASPTPTHSPSPTPSISPSASPSPSGSPASPTPTPTATPANIVLNGGFESGALSPWVPCYAKDFAEGPVDDNLPIPPNEDSTPLPASSPTPAATTSPDVTAIKIATSVPSGNAGGIAAVHSGTYAGLVGHSDLVLTTGATPTPRPLRGKGKEGICQDVAIPAGGAQISMWVFEGGNTSSLYSNNTSAAFYPSGSFVDSGRGATAATATTSQILFLEENCYDSLNFPTTFSPPMADCSPPSGVAVQGGVWKLKGPYTVSPSLNGTTVTLYLGIMGTSTSTTFYNYAYFDDVLLTSGTTTQSRARLMSPSFYLRH